MNGKANSMGDLCNMAQDMDEAWCVLGDFNSFLYTRDRMGGTEV